MADSPAPSDEVAPLRVGFLGAGLIARHHARSLRIGGAPLRWVGVHDPDRARAERFAREIRGEVFASEQALIEASDAVYVCTWTSEHPRLATAAAAAGRHVFCEKPLAVDLGAAQAMVDAVRAAGVTNQVGLVLRSSPGFALLRALLEVAPVGRVVNVTFRDDQELPVGGSYGSTWRLDAGRAGAGTLLEHSIHDLDIIEHLCGPIGAVSAHTAALGGHAGIEDTASLSFRLAGGGTGALTSIWHAIPGRFSNRRVEIFCERARLWAEGNMAETVGWEFRAGEPIVVSGDERTVALREHGGSPPPNPDRAFVLAAARARPSSPDFATALRAHAVADAAYRSAAAGGGGIAIPPPR